MDNVSARYATALFELACEKQCTDSWQKQMQFVRSVFEQHKDYLAFFAHYRITKEEKRDVLRKVFDQQIDRDLLNFLQLLLDKRRISNVIGITKAFNTLCNEAKNISEGIVYSVSKLSEEEIHRIEEAVGERLGMQLALTNKLDANLIRGIKVVVGDNVIDGSMQQRLSSLRSELLKESR